MLSGLKLKNSNHLVEKNTHYNFFLATTHPWLLPMGPLQHSHLDGVGWWCRRRSFIAKKLNC